MKHLLPPVLKEIAEAVSLQAALNLAEARGGQRVSIPTPTTLNDAHWLVEALGEEDAYKLCQYFTHDARITLDVPFGVVYQRALKHAKIDQMIKAGKSANDIAAELNCSRRWAIEIRQRIKRGSKESESERENEPDLFSDGF